MSADELVMNMDPRVGAGAAVWTGPDRIVAVAAGGRHNLLLTANGRVLASGSDERGQADVPAHLSGVKAIAAGFSHSLALLGDGNVVAWGNNSRGAAAVPTGLIDVVGISGGGGHSAALKRDGTVVVWGSLGTGSAAPPEGLTDVIAIASGWESCYALRRDGTVAAWGDSDFGHATLPDDLDDVAGIAALAGPDPRWVALKRDGTVRQGGATSSEAVPWGLEGVVQVAAGEGHVVALRGNGTAIGWGHSPVRQTVPAGLRDITAVASGDDHSLALRSNGTVVAWGKNAYGQLHGPEGYQTEFVGWENDGYYLPSVGAAQGRGRDPYAHEYGSREEGLDDDRSRPVTQLSEDDVRRSLQRAMDAEKRGDFDQAIKFYEKAVAESTPHVRLRALITASFARLLMRCGDRDQAIRWLTQLAETGESYGLSVLAMVLCERGDLDKSIYWFREALERWDESSVDRGDQDESLRLSAMSGLGQAHQLRGEVELAVQWYERTLENGQGSQVVRTDTARRLGIALGQQGRVEESIRWLRLSAESGDPHAYAALGTALQDTGKVNEGISWLTKAAVAGYVNAMVILGIALVGRGGDDHDKGVAWLQMAARSGNENASQILAAGVGFLRSTGQPTASGSPAKSGGGCYIATAVYGSYDAAPVLVLRRFRDERLARTSIGRAFIRVYYWVSPPMAKHFERVTLLNRVAKLMLDGYVSKLDAAEVRRRRR